MYRDVFRRMTDDMIDLPHEERVRAMRRLQAEVDPVKTNRRALSSTHDFRRQLTDGGDGRSAVAVPWCGPDQLPCTQGSCEAAFPYTTQRFNWGNFWTSPWDSTNNECKPIWYEVGNNICHTDDAAYGWMTTHCDAGSETTGFCAFLYNIGYIC